MTEDLQPVILPGTEPPPSLAGAPDGGDADACPRGGWAAPEDLELAGCLKRIGGGDEDALAELYDTTGGRVHGIVLRIVRDTVAAEEVVEDVFFQVWRQALRYDPARGRPLAWILTIARSRALDHLRRADPALCHPEPHTLLEVEPQDGGDPPDLLAACQDSTRVHAALAALDPVPRQLIALVFLRGLTHEEVAQHAGLPLGTVKSHVRRALLSLRATLTAHIDRSTA